MDGTQIDNATITVEVGADADRKLATERSRGGRSGRNRRNKRGGRGNRERRRSPSPRRSYSRREPSPYRRGRRGRDRYSPVRSRSPYGRRGRSRYSRSPPPRYDDYRSRRYSRSRSFSRRRR
ncbi:hypothetical protein LPJ70_006890 [Coemansia sp. RSA 2708]|nr:hypothetical protein LPJ70_006890 [Coemansia sp. RSA 2708]